MSLKVLINRETCICGKEEVTTRGKASAVALGRVGIKGSLLCEYQTRTFKIIRGLPISFFYNTFFCKERMDKGFFITIVVRGIAPCRDRTTLVNWVFLMQSLHSHGYWKRKTGNVSLQVDAKISRGNQKTAKGRAASLEKKDSASFNFNSSLYSSSNPFSWLNGTTPCCSPSSSWLQSTDRTTVMVQWHTSRHSLSIHVVRTNHIGNAFPATRLRHGRPRS